MVFVYFFFRAKRNVIESINRGPQKILLYFWGEGANKQKTDKRLKWVCLVKSEICDVIRAFSAFWRNPAQLRTTKYAPSHEPVKNPKNPSNSRRFRKSQTSKFWLFRGEYQKTTKSRLFWRDLFMRFMAVGIWKTYDIFNFFCLTIKKYRV